MRWRRQALPALPVLPLLALAVAAPPWRLRNEVLDGDLGDLRCSRLVSEVRRTEATLSARLPPDLDGTWVSQRCEVRPGPEFLLRKYKFLGNSTSFELLQFYYADPSCSTPTHGVMAEGSLQLTAPSWTLPGGMDADYFLTSVRLKAYSLDIAEVLTARANRSCPGQLTKPWRPRHWTTVFRYVEGAGNDVTEEEVDCLHAFGLVFHEVQLLRTESRKWRNRKSGKAKGRRTELLLGDVHPDPEKRNDFRPTGYQVPLLRSDQVKTSAIGRLVLKGTDVFPPNLRSRAAALPLQLRGEWISTRCETRPFSMFLTRRLTFYEGPELAWSGEYQYFLDSRCRKALFGLSFRGRHRTFNASAVVDGASDVDFLVDSLVLTAHTSGMVSTLNGHVPGSCGTPGGWRLGVPQDLGASGGCHGLGLRVPSRELEISRLEMDRQGDSWLFVGQPSGQGPPGTRRPTSYQLPLLQCKVHAWEEVENALYQLPGPVFSARVQADRSSGNGLELGSVAVMAILVVLGQWRFW